MTSNYKKIMPIHPKGIVLLLLMSLTAPLIAQENFEELMDYLREKSKTPEEYIVEKFEDYDIILLGEDHLVRENLIFVQHLIPRLHKNGIYSLGMEFGAYENQHLMDSLVTAPEFDAGLAEDMMFDYNVAWAFKEYVDMAKVAWEFNRTLNQGETPFRILNLSYIYDWEGFNGTRDIESMQKVFHKGTADRFRTQVIEDEILKKNEKILALVGTPHAYTKYGSSYYLYNADDFCAFDFNWLGNRLYKKIPGAVFNILLHQPFREKSDTSYLLTSPLEGTIERLMEGNNNLPVGFDLINSPIGKLEDHSLNARCYEDFTIGQLFDGYIFLEPLKELEGCTVIERFVNDANYQEALDQFPDPDWHPEISSLSEMIQLIKSKSERIKEEYGKL